MARSRRGLLYGALGVVGVAVVGGGIMPGPMVVIGPTLFFGSELDGGGIYAIDRGNGRIRWKFEDGNTDGDDWFLATDGSLLFASRGNRVYALPPL